MIMKNVINIFFSLMILTVGAFAQEQVPTGMTQVQKNFNLYTTNSLQEKVFVHTDKNAYTAGELLWFKIYNVDGIFLKPLNISKVVYVEVLDNNQNPILQTKIAMKDGAGSGSIYIPLTVSTGNYILRAYTSWMKNFSPDYYFSKKLTVINPLKSPDPNNKATAANYDIQFFPEGGSLVNSITSVIAFKAADQWGKGVNFEGAVLNEKNDTITKFRPLKFGIGRFTFKPENNVTYHAVIKINNKIIRKDLPAANGNGYVMSLKDAGAGQLLVTVNTNLATSNIYLFAQTRNVIKLIKTAVCNNGTANFNLDKNKLGDGISQITVFDAERHPVCERLYFKRPGKSLTISAMCDAQQYITRKKVSISIAAKDQNEKPAAADLSLSVYRLDSLQRDDKVNIFNYLWLSSDLKGYIESPDYYFDNSNTETNEAIDNLMLTQGWRSFAWSDLIKGKAPVFNFLPEFNGPIITARISDQLTKKPAKNIVAYLGIAGKSVQLYASKSDSTGHLNFNMRAFYGPVEIVAETNTEIDTTYHIDILSPFSEQFAKIQLAGFAVTPDLQTTFEDQSLAMQVQNIYNGPRLRQFYDPHADSSAFYGSPYKTYLLDNYTRFTTVEEVMREYIREVNITHLRNQFHIKVVNGIGFLSDRDPLVLVDGIPFFNMNKIFAIDPLKLRKLEVVPYTYYLGPSSEEGVFSFNSYKGDFGGAEIDPHAVIVDYEGLQMQRQFYSPAYDTEQQAVSPMPDFRNLLFWSASINTNVKGRNQVSFYTSDQDGIYIGVIQGITPNGEAGSHTFTFEVKSKYTAQINK